MIHENLERWMSDAVAPLGVTTGDWNDFFWAVHPGGRAMLDSVEEALELRPSKLIPSRKVLAEYGNMSGLDPRSSLCSKSSSAPRLTKR